MGAQLVAQDGAAGERPGEGLSLARAVIMRGKKRMVSVVAVSGGCPCVLRSDRTGSAHSRSAIAGARSCFMVHRLVVGFSQ